MKRKDAYEAVSPNGDLIELRNGTPLKEGWSIEPADIEKAKKAIAKREAGPTKRSK